MSPLTSNMTLSWILRSATKNFAKFTGKHLIETPKTPNEKGKHLKGKHLKHLKHLMLTEAIRNALNEISEISW